MRSALTAGVAAAAVAGILPVATTSAAPLSPRQLLDPLTAPDPRQRTTRLLAIRNFCPFAVLYSASGPSSSAPSSTSTSTTPASPAAIPPGAVGWLPITPHPSAGTAVKLSRGPFSPSDPRAPISQFEFFVNSTAPAAPAPAPESGSEEPGGEGGGVLRMYYDLSNVDCRAPAPGEAGCPFWERGMRVDVVAPSPSLFPSSSSAADAAAPSATLPARGEDLRLPTTEAPEGDEAGVELDAGEGVGEEPACPALVVPPGEGECRQVYKDAGDGHATRACDVAGVVVVWEVCSG